MAIEKNTEEWNMMRDLFLLYTLVMDDLAKGGELADKQNEFEKKYANVFGAKDFSNAIESMILRRLKNGN